MWVGGKNAQVFLKTLYNITQNKRKECMTRFKLEKKCVIPAANVKLTIF